MTDTLADKYLHEEPRVEEGTHVIKRNVIVSFLSGSAVVVGVVGLTTTLFVSKSVDQVGGLFQSQVSSAEVRQVNDRLSSQIKSLNNDILAMRVGETRGGKEVPVDVNMQNILGRLALIERRQARLDAIILDNPEKALTMPLLKRDIDNMREANTQALASIKASADQSWDLSKWLIGGVFFGVLSLALVNFTKK
jgi:hypothetical protein